MSRFKKLKPKRLYSGIIRRLNNFGILLPTRQFIRGDGKGTQLLVVASGSIPIPTSGWGAVEKIISETLPLLEDSGFSTSVLNSKHKKEWSLAANKKFDLVLCHDDSSIEKVKEYFPKVPVVTITHYGSIPLVNEWDPSYLKVTKSFSLANKVVALSHKCRTTLEEQTQLRNIVVCPNGILPIQYQVNPRMSRAIYLGKIEPRKRQLEIARRYPQLAIDFVGPGKIPRRLKKKPPTGIHFLGPQNKSWLKENLSRYDIGILISKSEADPLVLYEYQNAGLKILVSELALGDQDSNLPWVKVTCLEDLGRDLDSMRNLEINPGVISNHASENYSWETRITKLVGVLRTVSP